jgi:peptidyl-prolyl cis-trans isomerase C
MDRDTVRRPVAEGNKEIKEQPMIARARHILVKTQEACADLKTQIEKGADFAELAQAHSQCPSGKKGGDLGEFHPGQMVREFDDVVFKEEVGTVHGPVQTQFGFHLIEVTNRAE